MSVRTYHGSCHCGAVRYETELDLSEGSGRCNCSICQKLRNWSIIVKPQAFRLQSGDDALSNYQFGTKSGQHLFCKHCGVHAFGRGNIPEIGGEFVSVKVACLDDVTPAELAEIPVRYFNGRDNDWFHTPAETRYL